MKKFFLVSLLLFVLTGCGTVYQNTITLTATVDAAAKEYAHYYNSTNVSEGFDAQVNKYHMTYRKAARSAADGFKAYKLSQNTTDYLPAFIEAQRAAISFVDLLAPVITKTKSDQYKSTLTKAKAL